MLASVLRYPGTGSTVGLSMVLTVNHITDPRGLNRSLHIYTDTIPTVAKYPHTGGPFTTMAFISLFFDLFIFFYFLFLENRNS